MFCNVLIFVMCFLFVFGCGNSKMLFVFDGGKDILIVVDIFIDMILGYDIEMVDVGFDMVFVDIVFPDIMFFFENECLLGVICIETLFVIFSGDISVVLSNIFDVYSCKVLVDESGLEIIY